MNNTYTIEEVKKALENFSEFNDARGAYEYHKGLKDFLEQQNLKETNPKLYGEYYNLLIKLKFLALNFFDDWSEIERLIEKHFEVIFEIDNYNLWTKIKVQLLTTPNLGDRTNIKNKLNRLLLANNKIIINKEKYADAEGLPLTISDWLKDYNSKLGVGKADNLKRNEYLANSDHIKRLNEEDWDKIKKLLDFYENTKFTSDTREGFENDTPMVIKDKNVIFTQGKFEEISPKVFDLIKSIKTSSTESSEVSSNVKQTGQDQLAELQNIADQYAEGSLERKAIEEEIRKLKS